ncbi:MAG: helix-turn-helix domain-containing protein [Desulfobacteraceae bacterium]|nr:helix-turn-helix domain-containing protein [Desulfobacteraceae bacterium]
MAKKKIDESVKQKVVEARASGLSLKKIADQYGISTTSVSRIIKDKGPLETPKKKTDRQRRIEALEIRIAELEKKILDLEAKQNL